MVFALANVTVCSTVWFAVHCADALEVCFALEVSSAVAFTEPPPTEAASVAKSAATAALMAMVSPAVTAPLVVIVSLVWLAIVSMPVNNVFQFDACIVPPTATVAISV